MSYLIEVDVDRRLGERRAVRPTCSRRVLPRRAPTHIEAFEFAPDGKTLAISCDDTSVLIWDINRPLGSKASLPLPRDAVESERLWQLLGNPDATIGDSALWALVGGADQSVAMLRNKLQPIRSPGPERLRALIGQLDRTDFKARERAAAELAAVADFAITALREALKKDIVSVEQRRRIQALIVRFEDPAAIPPCLRELRAVEILERIGSAGARTLLQALASGDTEASLTREARSALARIRAR